MAGTTAKMAIPYPTGTDLVADGDNAMQSLAERVDVTSLYRLAGPTGYTAVEHNSTSVTTDTNGGAFITFPTAFTATPVIILSSGDQNGVSMELVANPSFTDATKFLVSVKLTTTGAAYASQSCRVNWIAIGPK